MNTEFPSRVPTVTNTDSTNTVSGLSDKMASQLQNIIEGALENISKTPKWLENINTKLSEFVKDKDKDKKKDKDSKKDKKSKKDDSEKEQNSLFRRKMTSMVSGLSSTYKKGIESLQATVESTSDAVGDAIGSVFGSGLLGKVIGNAVSGVMKWAVGKILVGMIMSNLPAIGITAAVVALGAFLYSFAEEIWNGIKYIGYGLDQAIDAITHLFSKGKYETAREEMAKSMGVSERAILDYYGGTVRGRNQAYEDWKAMETDKDLRSKIKSELSKQQVKVYEEDHKFITNMQNYIKSGNLDKSEQMSLVKTANAKMSFIDDYNNKAKDLKTDNAKMSFVDGSNNTAEELNKLTKATDDLKEEISYINNNSNTSNNTTISAPVINNTSNNTAINSSVADNISKAYPGSTLDNQNHIMGYPQF